MRTGRRAEHVVRRLDGRRPVAERFTDGILERPGTDGDLVDLGAHQPHAEHVHPLPLDIVRAHVDLAVIPRTAAAMAVAVPC